MKSKWKISHQKVCDVDIYQVYRLRDVDAVDHAGNREYGSEALTSLEDAEELAEELNKEE